MRRSVSSSEQSQAAVARRASEPAAGCIREEVKARQVVEGSNVHFDSTVAFHVRWPNQSPEPTRGTGAVISDGLFPLNVAFSSEERRLVSAPRVAHL